MTKQTSVGKNINIKKQKDNIWRIFIFIHASIRKELKQKLMESSRNEKKTNIGVYKISMRKINNHHHHHVGLAQCETKVNKILISKMSLK